jgi:lysophospholipase L1-like esterase
MDGWVASWGCALQTPDGTDDPPLAGATLRQTIRVGLGGPTARLRFSNEYGRGPLPIAAAAVATPVDGRAGANGIEPGSSTQLTFAGATEAAIEPGGRLTSDPFPLAAQSRTNLSVTIQLAAGVPVEGVTTHPGSRTTTHAVPAAAFSRDPGPAEQVAHPVLPEAVPIEHWYFLAALEVRPYGGSGAGPSVAVLLGDSLTDGRGSTTDGNDRWPDLLLDRLHQREGLPGVGIVNQAAGGNRLLRDGLGVAALSRLRRDVLDCAGAAWLVVFEGVNDIGTTEATPRAQERVGDELLAGYREIIERAHRAGIRVYGATITPFGGHQYDDPAGLRDRTRKRVNAWIRAGHFDAVLDFDEAVREAADHRRVRPTLHDGDGLHLNPAGYRALAGAVPAALFR